MTGRLVINALMDPDRMADYIMDDLGHVAMLEEECCVRL
jgi:hypothetical protein